MGCGSSTQVHPATEGGAETNAMQAMAQQIAALRSENVALQEKLTSTRSDLADAKQTIVALQEQLTSTRSELANAVTREQSATGRLSFLASMDKDEKDLAERIATLKLELTELETSAFSASQGALSTLVEITAQAYPADSPAQVLGDTPVEAAVLEMDLTKSDEAARDFRMRLGMCIAAGPDAFFALADTKQEDILSPQGWLEACKSSLGNVDERNVDEALCRSLFDEMV